MSQPVQTGGTVRENVTHVYLEGKGRRFLVQKQTTYMEAASPGEIRSLTIVDGQLDAMGRGIRGSDSLFGTCPFHDPDHDLPFCGLLTEASCVICDRCKTECCRSHTIEPVWLNNGVKYCPRCWRRQLWRWFFVFVSPGVVALALGAIGWLFIK